MNSTQKKRRCSHQSDKNKILRSSSSIHQSFEVMNEMRRQLFLCDMTLVVDNVEIPAHKMVLAASSRYFYAMFSNFKESKEDRITLHELDAHVVKLLIEYIYTSEVEITEENVQDLFATANLLELTDVRDACCDVLRDILSPTNCFGIRSLANLHDCVDLLTTTNQYLEEHFLEIVESEDFLKQPLEEVSGLISNNCINAPSEEKEERILMWAHCCRKNAGINTNMAIESLNNFLKNNQLKRRTNITVEKLLDAIDGLVDIKMWHRILNMKRPNASNYQDRTVIKAHKKANAMKNAGVAVTEVMFGHYQIKSSNDEKVYDISYSELCESECRTLFCRVCKICVHRYTCECPEYLVKHTICKHVHLVRMFEEGVGANSVLDGVTENLNIKKESEIKKYQQQEIDNFIENKRNKTEEIIDCTNKKTLRQVWKEDFCNFIDGLEDDVFTNFTGIINKVRSKIETSNDTNVNKKRKMETQAHTFLEKSC